jgi:hypothetical protein
MVGGQGSHRPFWGLQMEGLVMAKEINDESIGKKIKK